MYIPNLVLATLALCLSSCSGGGNGPNEQTPSENETSDVDTSGTDITTSSNAITLTNGEIIDPLKCHEEQLSLLDAKADVMFDLPFFPAIKSIRDQIRDDLDNADSMTTQQVAGLFRLSNSITSLDLIALGMITPNFYTRLCNHELFRIDQCVVPGQTTMVTLNGPSLSATMQSADGTLIELTIDDGLARSGEYRFTDGIDASVNEGSWRRDESGTETGTVSSADIAFVFEENADCSGKSSFSFLKNGAVDTSITAEWSSPREDDFLMTLINCDNSDGTCSTFIVP